MSLKQYLLLLMATLFFGVSVTWDSDSTTTTGQQCMRRVSVMESRTRSQLTTKKEKYGRKCGLWGWRNCTAYRIVTEIVYKTEYFTTYKMVQASETSCPTATSDQDFISSKSPGEICKCYEHGTEDNICDGSTGQCLCREGFTGIACNEKCENYMYGENCIEECGHCSGGVACHADNGTCPQGCEEGWEGDACKSDREEESTSYGIIIGCVLAVLVAIVCLVLLIVFIRSRKRNRGRSGVIPAVNSAHFVNRGNRNISGAKSPQRDLQTGDPEYAEILSTPTGSDGVIVGDYDIPVVHTQYENMGSGVHGVPVGEYENPEPHIQYANMAEQDELSISSPPVYEHLDQTNLSDDRIQYQDLGCKSIYM